MFLSYPKILRYDHDLIEPEFYSAGDLTVVEKLDGSNSRIIMYDKDYRSTYPDKFLDEFNPSHKDIFFSSKRNVRGKIADDLETIDGAFHRLVKTLREDLSANKLKELHDEYESPLLLYGEHMVPHSINYAYDENPPPPFIGFDVLPLTAEHTNTSSPLDESFDGFLSLDEMRDVFTFLDLSISTIINSDISEMQPRDIESISIPDNEYSQTESEGVVIRSDTMTERVKYVREKFQEINRARFGLREDMAENGAELFVAKYVTNGRIRKQIHKHKTTDVEQILGLVIPDIWEEEVHDIQSFDDELDNSKVFSMTEERIEEVIEYLEKTATLNNTDIFSVWREFVPDYDASTKNEEIIGMPSKSVDEFSEKVKWEPVNSTEEAIVDVLLSEKDILDVASQISEERNKDIGNWAIRETYDQCSKRLWNSNRDLLANTTICYRPSKINEKLMDKVRRTIKNCE